MWYKHADKGFDILEQVANQVSAMNPYDVDKHFKLMNDMYDKEKQERDDYVEQSKDEDTADWTEDQLIESINKLKENPMGMRDYLSLYPQIYLYPNNKSGRWHLLVYDPTNPRAMDDDKFHEEFKSEFPNDTNVDDVIQVVHQHYPTALIDHYDTEEEKRRDD